MLVRRVAVLSMGCNNPCLGPDHPFFYASQTMGNILFFIKADIPENQKYCWILILHDHSRRGKVNMFSLYPFGTNIYGSASILTL